MISFDDRVWLLWAVWLLLLPLNWLAAAATAAVAHELCHMIAVVLLGGKIRHVEVRPYGTEMAVYGIDGTREVLCALAGPLGSFALVLLIHRFPVLGLCALVQGSFNLLPLYPLDGGRALKELLNVVIPSCGYTVFTWIEKMGLVFMLCISGWFCLRYSLGFFPFFAVVFVLTRALVRKSP